MIGMTVAMALGMSVGLTIGIIAGLNAPGNILTVTVIGSLAGLIAGILAGLPISLVAVLDGFLSGIMGGMMGAMLGVMIPPDQAPIALKIIIILYLAVMAIILMTLAQSNSSSKNGIQKVVTLAAFLLVFYTFNLSNLTINQLTNLSFGKQMSNMEMNLDKDQKSKNLIVDAEEFRFLPNVISIKKGQPVTITLDNTGKVEHDLEIVGATQRTFKLIKKTGVTHQHGPNDVHVHSAPGQKESISFIPEESGTYKFICTIPGHKEAGMIGEIMVN